MGKDLLDIYGDKINTNDWYKIMLANGTELGWSTYTVSGICPSARGAVVRYHRFRSDTDEYLYGWPEGDVGYIKGIGVNVNGDQFRRHLNLSSSAPPKLLWHESDDSSRFYAAQIPGNRIVLYGRTSNGQRIGLRVVSGEGIIVGQKPSDWPLGLDCAFVPVGNRQWAANGVGNF